MSEDKTEDTKIEAAEDEAEIEVETVIRDTDIVFDCPHCGHNLAIDYRGAGLPINCTNCGEPVLVPIPKEMKIDDLDLEPGEILKQLFATRRNLQRAEANAQGLEAQVYDLTTRLNAMWAKCETLTMQLGELKAACLQQAANNDKMTGILDHMAAELQQTQQQPTSDSAGTEAEEEVEIIEGESSAE